MTVTYSVFTPKFDEFRWKFEIIIKFWAIKKFINALIYPLSNQKITDHGSPAEKRIISDWKVALENYLDQS